MRHSSQRRLTVFFFNLNTFKLVNHRGHWGTFPRWVLRNGWTWKDKLQKHQCPERARGGAPFDRNRSKNPPSKVHMYTFWAIKKNPQNSQLLLAAKAESCSVSQIYIDTLIFNKWPQLQALCAAGRWKNSACWIKIRLVYQLGLKSQVYMTMCILVVKLTVVRRTPFPQ